MATVVALYSHGFTFFLFTCIVIIILIIVFIIDVIIIMTHSISATLAVKSYCCQFIETSGCILLTCSQIHPSLYTLATRGATPVQHLQL